MIQPQRGSARSTYTRAVPEAADPPLQSNRGSLDALQRVTDAALAFLSEQELLDELLLRVTEILDTDTAAILLLDEDGTLLRARAARGIEEEVEQGVVIPVGKGFAGRIVAERATVVVDDVDHADILNPILREKGIRSLLGAPLLLSGRPLGVLHVGSLVPRRFTDDERDLLQLAADRAALAIEHARAYAQERRARSTLESLQRITDAGLAYLPQDELLQEMLVRITEILGIDTAAVLLLDPDGERAPRAGRARARGEPRAERADPGRPGLRRPRRGEPRRRDRDRRRRPRRDRQPGPAREGHALAARRPAADRGPRARRPARRLARAAALHAPTSATCCSSPPTAPRWRSTTRCCSSSGGWPRRCSAGCCRRTSAARRGVELASRYLPASGETPRRRLVRRVPARPAAGSPSSVGDVVGHGIERGGGDGAAADRACAPTPPTAIPRPRSSSG